MRPGTASATSNTWYGGIMLRSLKDLIHFTLKASDGDVGEVADFYFDDERWVIRYLVADTEGFWKAPNQVLISPISFRQADWPTRAFHLALTVDKVRDSPGIDRHKPVSRQFEKDYSRYYGLPYYWGSTGIWGASNQPMELASTWWSEVPDEPHRGDPHLRSSRELNGYHILAMDETIGHVDDLIIDDETWSIRYLVVDTSNWWIGKKVLLAPLWVDQISWADNKVMVGLPREAIKNSPPWEPAEPVKREYETRLYDYYGRPAYWVDDDKK
jgi:uncharacterized protein YrrD